MKRLFDVLSATSGLLLLAPLILGIALLVRLPLGSPVLFSQIRPGLHGKLFKMIRFRAMTDASGVTVNCFQIIERLTHCGRWLRSTSLDQYLSFGM